MSYRIFSTNESGFGIECPQCKRVLKVGRENLNGGRDGWEAKTAVVCPCGYASININAAPLVVAKPVESVGPGQAVAFLLFGALAIFVLYQCNKPEDPAKAAARAASDRALLSNNSKYDGSVYWVEKYLKQNLKDPDSYQAIDWSAVQSAAGGRLEVRHKYRAKNSFGGYAIENKVFTFDESGNVYSAVDF